MIGIRNMKKINSNKYGGTVIGFGLILLVPIPLIFKMLVIISKLKLFELYEWISFMIGILILLLFTIWLFIEFLQDNYWNQYYANHKNERLKLSNGGYECQSCGNRNIKENDKNCNVCGMKFRNNNGECNPIMGSK